MAKDIYVCGPVCFVKFDQGAVWYRVPRCVAFVGCPLCMAAIDLARKLEKVEP